MRRREVGRIAVADVLNVLDVDAVGEALTDVALASLTGALAAATSMVEADRDTQLPVRLAVVSMGRLGGHEMGFASDADVLFVYLPTAGTDDRAATTAAQAVAAELRRMLGAAGAGLPLEVDADLRPEGRQGPLVRSLDSYAAYYARWAQPWEAQALLRAESLVGDHEVGQRFAALIDPLRWPQRGLEQDAETEIRRIKARMDAERLPRGVDPSSHVKLGPGGLTDVEWTAQLLQMRHAAEVPGLRTTRTVAALEAAAAADLLSASDADDLLAAWRLAQRLRNAVMHVRGRPSDVLPRDGRDLAGVAFLLGQDGADDQRLIETWRRTARRARSVVDRVFWQKTGRTWSGR
jgi:glutamate-ammonia-ligase adenylyltransferase